MLDKNFNTVEEGLEKLKKSVKIRNQMGGAMYWNILNDECCEIGNRLLSMGGKYVEIGSLIGEGNFR
jgi:hypothetical protein